MALTDEVISRVSAQRLADITNPQNSTGSSYDSARLSLAATDVEAFFRIYAGVAYDNANAQHVAVAIEGVVVRLKYIVQQSATKEDWTDWVATLRDMSRVGARDRILPKSNSVLTPTSERVGTETVIPKFDETVFNEQILDKP